MTLLNNGWGREELYGRQVVSKAINFLFNVFETSEVYQYGERGELFMLGFHRPKYLMYNRMILLQKLEFTALHWDL
jgi:hypothetical protein